MKITLLYQVSHYIRAKKQRNINSWDQQNYLVLRGFCYIRPLYNEVPLYHLHHHLNYQHHILYHLHHHHIISFIAITVSSPYHFHHQIIFIIMFVFIISIILSSPSHYHLHHHLDNNLHYHPIINFIIFISTFLIILIITLS